METPQQQQQQEATPCVTTTEDLEEAYTVVEQLVEQLVPPVVPESQQAVVAGIVALRTRRQYYGCDSPFTLTHNTVELFESPIHGRGVRATREIPAGVIVTFFPCHAMAERDDMITTHNASTDDEFTRHMKRYALTHLYTVSSAPLPLPATTPPPPPPSEKPVHHQQKKDRRSKAKKSATAAQWDTALYEGVEINEATKNECAACCFIGNPRVTDNPLLLGHMINDAVGRPFRDLQQQNELGLISEKRFKNATATYLILEQTHANCHFVTNRQRTIVSVVTKRGISAGEELFVAYGPYYWFLQQYALTAEAELREECEIKAVYSEAKRLFDRLYGDKEFSAWYLSKCA